MINFVKNKAYRKNGFENIGGEIGIENIKQIYFSLQEVIHGAEGKEIPCRQVYWMGTAHTRL